MLLIALAAAATAPAFKAPEPIQRWKWFRDYDRTSGLAPDHFYVVLTALTIAPNGRVVGCLVEKTSGDRRFDLRTCEILKKRARFKPAVGEDGRAMYGLFRTGSSVAVFDRAKQMPLPPVNNLELNISRLPEGLGPHPDVRVTFTTNQTGRATRCKGMSDYDNPTLVNLACKEVLTNVTDRPVMDEVGRPVDAVRTLTIGFTAG